MHPFPYDRFQAEAISTIREGVSVFVSAPTGAGKTVIAEVAVEEALRAGGMAIYTAPVKALSNQKFRDFHTRYKEMVGILTGDITLNPDAPLLIMTTEIYRNALFERKSRFSRCRWIIFDEVHYLDDPQRGTVWEEALLLTPRETEILALSATIPNAQQLASWIEKIHGRPVKVIQETHRPVPLQFSFQCQNQLFSDLDTLKTKGYRGKDQLGTGRSGGHRPFRMGRHRGGRYYFKKRSSGFSPIPDHRGQPNRADHLVREILSADRIPCLYFTFSRRRVENLASEFARMEMVSPEIQKKLLARFDELCKRYELTHENSAAEMRELVAQGVAFHHAGLLPTLKEVVEVLFTSRLIQVIVTTETFALGINMPARSVVLDTLAKRTSGPRTVLKIRELSQMAGRAGRRGMDEKGFVYLRVNPWEIPFPQLQNLLQGTPEQVSSRFNLTYATLLNLYQHYGENILPFYQKTLHAHQTSIVHQREAMNLIGRKLSLLKKLGYLQSPSSDSLLPSGEKEGEGEKKLTPKGEFANTLYGYELLLSELFSIGWLDTLNLTDLGIFLLAVVYEPRRGAGPPPRLSQHLYRLAEETYKVLEAIHREERNLRLSPLTSRPAFHLSSAMERWVNGGRFDQVVQLAGSDEGELIRYFRMTIQLARTLTLSNNASEALRDKAGLLIRKINRDVVDAEAELRRSL